MKKNGNRKFDVTMESYDGVEMWELVVMFALTQLLAKYKKRNLGLYRDNGLAVFKGVTGSEMERIKTRLNEAVSEPRATRDD